MNTRHKQIADYITKCGKMKSRTTFDLFFLKEEKKIIGSIIAYLGNNSNCNLSFINLSDINKNKKHNRELLFKTLSALVGGKMDLLSLRYKLIENDNSIPCYIDENYLRDAMKSKKMYHPHFGHKIRNFQSKIFIVFTITDNFKKLFADK